MGMVPNKGLALPLVSYGGTSLVCNLFALGVLLNISSQTSQNAHGQLSGKLASKFKVGN
jgi:cell division protein FtsW